MKILYLIPARGGSKGLPGKNIKKLGNKPLINYSIEFVFHVDGFPPWLRYQFGCRFFHLFFLLSKYEAFQFVWGLTSFSRNNTFFIDVRLIQRMTFLQGCKSANVVQWNFNLTDGISVVSNKMSGILDLSAISSVTFL